MDLTRAIWHKSTRSNANGACVEVANLAGTIGVRDSKDVDGGVLTFELPRWSAFVATLKKDSRFTSSARPSRL
jgi:hypothetical protein